MLRASSLFNDLRTHSYFRHVYGALLLKLRVEVVKNNSVIADKCHVAECFFDRLRGLIGRGSLAPGEAMHFPRCNSVHMWFMRFPIDVVFVRLANKSDGTEVRVISSVRENIRPWRLLPLVDLKANEALELPAGVARERNLAVGDEICFG